MASPPPSPHPDEASASAEEPPSSPSTLKRSADDEPVSEDTDIGPPPHKRMRTEPDDTSPVYHPWNNDDDILTFRVDTNDESAYMVRRGVQAWNIAQNVFSARGAEGLALFLPTASRNLTYLNVSNIAIKIEGVLMVVTGVAQMAYTQLRSLHMGNVQMEGAKDADRLACVLREFATTLAITELTMKDNAFGGDGVVTVAHALRCLSTLLYVDLSGCAPSASDRVCEAVADCIRIALEPARMLAADRPCPDQQLLFTVTHLDQKSTTFHRELCRYTQRDHLHIPKLRAQFQRVEQRSIGGPTVKVRVPTLCIENGDHRIEVFGGATVKQLLSVLCKVQRYKNEVCSRWEYIPENLARLDYGDGNHLIGDDSDVSSVNILSVVGKKISIKSPRRAEFERRAHCVWVFEQLKIPADVMRLVIDLTVPYIIRDTYVVTYAHTFNPIPTRVTTRNNPDKAWFYST